MTTSGQISAIDESSAQSRIPNYARRLLEAERCILLVIDIQEKLLPPIFNRDELVRNSKLLMQLASILKIPMLATTQYERGLGATVPEIASLLGESTPIDKVEFACLGSEAFCSKLSELPAERDTLLLCGMESHICVMQTALSSLGKGYCVHVASDAVGSRTEANWIVGLERMQAAGCVISSTEMMLYELMRKSGTAAFKEMLPLLK